QLALQRSQVAPIDRIGDLVGLLDGVGDDGGEVLLQIPGTATLGIAQAGHDGDQCLDVAVRLAHCGFPDFQNGPRITRMSTDERRKILISTISYTISLDPRLSASSAQSAAKI